MKKILSSTPLESTKPGWLKENINDLIKEFKRSSRATIFWNSVIYIVFIIGLFINYEVTLSLVTGLCSLLTLGLILDADEHDKSPITNYWVALTGLFWLAIFGGLIFFGLYKLYMATIDRFNNWLNTPKS